VTPGEIFGAMSAIDGEPRIASARAVEDTVCIAIRRAIFEQKIAAADPFIAALLRWFVHQSRERAMQWHPGTSKEPIERDLTSA